MPETSCWRGGSRVTPLAFALPEPWVWGGAGLCGPGTPASLPRGRTPVRSPDGVPVAAVTKDRRLKTETCSFPGLEATGPKPRRHRAMFPLGVLAQAPSCLSQPGGPGLLGCGRPPWSAPASPGLSSSVSCRASCPWPTLIGDAPVGPSETPGQVGQMSPPPQQVRGPGGSGTAALWTHRKGAKF